MHNPKAPGKLLTFPASTLSPESAEHWIDQVLHTKDHLVDAPINGQVLRSATNRKKLACFWIETF